MHGKLSSPKASLDAESFALQLLQAGACDEGEMLLLFEKLPRAKAEREDRGFVGRSWSSGMYTHGGCTGLRRLSRKFPLATKVFNMFIRSKIPEASFTTFAVLDGILSPPHRDSHNAVDSLSWLIPVTLFRHGELWLEDSEGEVPKQINGEAIAGKLLPLQHGPVSFPPRRWHATEAWEGRRVVIAVFTVRNFDRLTLEDRKTAESLGFRLPSIQGAGSLDRRGGSAECVRSFSGIRKPSLPSSITSQSYTNSEWESDRLDAATVKLLETFSRSQFILPRQHHHCFSELLQMPGFLDLYSGSKGVARAAAAKSGRWVLCFDFAFGASQNLLDPELQRRILELLGRKAFIGAGGGPVCSSFSRAVRPPVRSRDHPLGVPQCRESMREKVEQGNRHAAFTAEVAELALDLHIPIWIENPHGSFFWSTPWWAAIRERCGAAAFGIVDYCMLGLPWRKRTRLFLPGAPEQRLLCDRGHAHQVLKGYSRVHGQQWTKLAEAYPRALNNFLAEYLCSQLLPPEQRRRLDISACARCLEARIGEASHPGPSSLEEVELVTPATAKLQARVLEGFEGWLFRVFSASAARSLPSCAMALVHLLRLYGDHLYQSGEPMYKFRHLLAYFQKNRFDARPFMPAAWDFLTRWERVCPVIHRVPVPEAVCEAL